MPSSRARRTGIVTLLALLLGVPLLELTPVEFSAVRLAGIGLLWWYAMLVAPVAAGVLVTTLLLAERG